MYHCRKCGGRFSEPAILTERHGLAAPPYETRAVCPYCAKNDAVERIPYCRCCGAKMDREGLYCSDACRRRAGILAENAKRRKQAQEPIDRILRRKEDYNRRHGTRYSYGQYVALVAENRKEKKKHVRRQKTVS